ncbi:hypothetical protein [Aeromicrobium sp. Leaf350]|uniref:hypothetical protein n=1 Tax=Aeromicrobium sp. Leaf350 TaxID=2876565 RepID=UPI001E2953B5|nr:hypothetical protein [Aeromicrobium sp. Leaf350]
MSSSSGVPGAHTFWPPSFPHADIDRLVERLDSGAGDGDDAERLLLAVTREAQRLRSAVVRLSAARLAAAEQEAHDIMTRAHADAEDVRRRALRALDDRLDEADHLVRAMRRSFLVEQKARGHFPPDEPAEDDPESFLDAESADGGHDEPGRDGPT